MDAVLRNRILLGLAAVVAVVVAFALNGRATAKTETLVAELREHDVDAAAARAKAVQRDIVMNRSGRRFQEVLDEDTKRFSVQPVAADSLRSGNVFEHLVRDNVVLKPGQTFKSDWVEIKAAVEQIKYIRRGAEVRAKHSLVYVENKRAKPIAYFLDVRSADAAGCEVRGSRSHNANALLPGEVAEVVVCAGTRPVEIHDLRVMEVTALGYMYLSQVPARAFGHDEVRAQSHRMPRQARRCSEVPSERLFGALREQRIRWRDVADFFSRHNCTNYPWLWGYTYDEAGVDELPVSRKSVKAAE